MRLVAVALVALAAVPLAGAAAPFTSIGTILLAGGALPTDACKDSTLQGVSSTCTYVRADARGKMFGVTASGVGVAGVKTCYYDLAKAPLGCQGGDASDVTGRLRGTFPANAAYVAVSTMAGAKVTWILSTA